MLYFKNKKKVYFSKMHGLGNDFIIINCIEEKFSFSSSMIKKLSDRHTGIGFDQLLVVEKSYNDRYDFHYRIFNANGHEVEQCGNGARCFGLFLKLKGLIHKNSICVSTKSQDLIVTVLSEDMIQVNMNQPCFNIEKILLLNNIFIDNFVIHLINENIKCSIVSMGNPHCIIQVQSIQDAPVAKIGKILEQNTIFLEGINVSFMQIINKNHIKLRVYERDVGETQACGSAACAAVSIGIIRSMLDHTVHVDLIGGSLIVKWKGVGHSLYMTGPAKHVYEGYIYK